jgi:hypothetical protein
VTALVKPTPTIFSGTRFRSLLEAEWAATLDGNGISWVYEPERITLPSGAQYVPDFFLPEISTWLEVKGPHNQRIAKTFELTAALEGLEFNPAQMVVVGRDFAADHAIAEGLLRPLDGVECLMPECRAFFWVHPDGSYRCRKCGAHDGDHLIHSVSLPPYRAPREECERCIREAHEKCVDRGLDVGDAFSRKCSCACWERS